MRAFLSSELNAILDVCGHGCQTLLDLGLAFLRQHPNVPRDDVGERSDSVHIVSGKLLMDDSAFVEASAAGCLLLRREAYLAAHAVVRANEQLARVFGHAQGKVIPVFFRLILRSYPHR